MIGKTVSHYKIIEKLGGGGMGVVYKAQDLKLDRFVALKFLPPHLTTSEEEKQRFIHEAKAASSLQHNNICAIHEIDETDDNQVFICMDYYAGETLDKKIEKKPLPIENAIDIAIQIAQGLAKAHEKEIVHRDIKPANIMLTADGVVKILDFGLAKLSTQTKSTKEGTAVGTVAYMSPEQTQGAELDQSTDIWSLGVILYEMFTGELPFKGDQDQVLIYSILKDNQEPLTSLRTGVPMEMERVTNKCLNKNAANRYQHIDELIVDLRNLQPINRIIQKKQAKKWFKSLTFAVAVLSILIISISGYFFLFEQFESEAHDFGTTKWDNSIAVLPFADLSPKKDQEYFCDGMTEQIITNLTKMSGLKVIGLNSVMKFKNLHSPLSEIGSELNVSHILEGSIRKNMNKVRVTAQLINTQDGSHLWAEDYDRKLENIFKIQDDISEMIANVLIKRLTSQDITALKSQRPNHLKAWEYYLKGKYFHEQKFIGATNRLDYFEKSESMFKKTIAIAPKYVPAYAGIADLYNTNYNTTHSIDEKPKLLELQRRYISLGLNIDPNSAEIHDVNGWYLMAKGDYNGSFKSFSESNRISPNRYESNYGLGSFYLSRGMYDHAIHYYTRALEINPIYPIVLVRRSNAYFFIGNLTKAESELLKTLQIDSNHQFAIIYYIRCAFWLNKHDSLKVWTAKYFELFPNSTWNPYFEAMLYVLEGHKERALNYDLKPWQYNHISLYLEMMDEPIKLMEEAFESNRMKERSNYLRLKYNKMYDYLRSDPRFQKILAKHKKLYEENLVKYGDIDI